MPNLGYCKKTLRSISIVLAKALFLGVIWIPNLVAIQSYCHYLISNKTLQSNLLVRDFAFVDSAKYYAFAEIAKTSPNNLWNPVILQNWFKNYLQKSQLTNKDIAIKVGSMPDTPQTAVLCMVLTRYPLNKAIVILE